MNNLYNDLSPAIQKLSEIFCVSAEHLQEHLMEYVLMYGKYYMARDVLAVLVIAIVIPATLLLAHCILEGEPTETFVRISLGIGLIVAIVGLIWNFVLWNVSPEIYSVDAVMGLINGG